MKCLHYRHLNTLTIYEIERLMNDVDEMGVYLNGVKVSIIMYADDLVLISKTKHGLQLGMNALFEFCSANTLTVNTNKSKVMYVSKRKPASLPVIHYNNMSLRWVGSFRYLGVDFIGRTTSVKD